MRHFLKEKKTKISFLKKCLLRFLSLRYSADFGRSRLVLNGIRYETFMRLTRFMIAVVEEVFQLKHIREGTVRNFSECTVG